MQESNLGPQAEAGGEGDDPHKLALLERVAPLLVPIDLIYIVLISMSSERPWVSALLVLAIPGLNIPAIRLSARTGRPVFRVSIGLTLFVAFLLPATAGPACPAWLPMLSLIWGAMLFVQPRWWARTCCVLLVLCTCTGSLYAGIELEGVALIASVIVTLLVISDRIVVTLERYVFDLERLQCRLSASNAELEQFACVVSHDLKAPLRGISNLSVWIREDLEEIDGADRIQENLERLETRAQRMRSMIDGILAYAQFESGAAGASVFDPRETLTSIAETECDPRGNFSLVVSGEWPRLAGSASALRQVIANLVTNAVKHHHRGRGEIQVHARIVDDHSVEIAVLDDGPGIPEEAMTRIFDIFETLGDGSSKENTGIGLALVRKLVGSAGGRVYVESDGRSFSRFVFTWPRAREDRLGPREFPRAA